MDVKDGTTSDRFERYLSIIEQFDSYTEYSQSGRGFHVWVKGKIGSGKRRDGIEVYSQARFMICTGNVVRSRPIVERQALLTNMVTQMTCETVSKSELWGDDTVDWSAAARAIEDGGELGRLFGGDWEGRYPSQSEADLALVKLLLPLTASPLECWRTFQQSVLGKRSKAHRSDYAERTVALALQHLANDDAQLQHGQTMAEMLLGQQSTNARPGAGAQNRGGDRPRGEAEPGGGATRLEELSINWQTDEDVEVPDIIRGLVADEEVTLLGGHGGVGKGFLALQFACSVAVGEPVLGCSTRRSRVLYYSAEDGRKRLTRRLRRVAEMFDYDTALLSESLRVLDASEINPLYGERLEQSSDGKRFAKMLGPTVEFENLRQMVEAFDPQLVIIDGASDTFDGNEIARREVRAFIKMLRCVHPLRNIGVLLVVHIDRSSARGYSTNDDGYAGSAQWHNSSRRRLFLHHQLKKERGEDGEETILDEKFVLRVMKNQDGQTSPDMELQRAEWGLWQLGVQLGGNFAPSHKPDYGTAIARLIGQYYDRGHFISASLAPNAPTGVYATLKGDPAFPSSLTKKRTNELVRTLKREGILIEEPYKRGNRTSAERWMLLRDPESPFKSSAQGAPGGTG